MPKIKTKTNAFFERLAHLKPIKKKRIVSKVPEILREVFGDLSIISWNDSYMGPTGYIDVPKRDIKGKAVQGIDSHGRCFVAFIDKKGNPGVVFQRYNSEGDIFFSNKRWVLNQQVNQDIKDITGSNIAIQDDGSPSEGFLTAIAAHV